MPQTLVKKIFGCLLTCLLLLTCTSCKTTKAYSIKEYLTKLSVDSGLSDGVDFDEVVSSLINWQVIEDEDLSYVDEDLTYEYLSKTICHLIEYDGDYLEHLNELGWLNSNDSNSLVSEEVADKVIEKAVDFINNKEFENYYFIQSKDSVKEIEEYEYSGNLLSSDELLNIGDYIYLEDDGCYKKVVDYVDGQYVLEDSEFEEVIEELNISGSYEIDLDEAIDVPYGETEDNTSYVNESGRTLLSSPSTKSKSFSSKGYRINYSFKRSGINARISKKIGVKSIYFDLSLTNIKPTYKWDYKDGVINEAYLKVDYNSTEKLGVSIGKYQKYTLDFSDKDTSSVLNYLKSVIKEKDDEVEETIKICEIKTPIPNMPTVYFNIEVLAKIYASGRAELILYNKHTKGLEVKNGSLRMINDTERDADFKIGGSARACLGLNFNLQAVDKYLMDVEIDAGVRAAVSSTVHLYDSDGNINSVSTDMPYYALDDIAEDNDNLQVCGDVSLNWVLDIYVNTYRTVLHKFALWTRKSILDQDNQIFNNKTHIENGVFVKSCTRKKRFSSTTSVSTSTSIDKLILSKHNAVVVIGDNYQIEVTNLPSGYKTSDLVYKSLDESIASVNESGVVTAKALGACDIEVSTSDSKYTAMINILVSSG